MSSRSKFDKTFVAEILELLANLIVDEIVFWMFHLKFISKRIYLIQREVVIRYSLNAFQNVQQPSSAVNLCSS